MTDGEEKDEMSLGDFLFHHSINARKSRRRPHTYSTRTSRAREQETTNDD